MQVTGKQLLKMLLAMGWEWRRRGRHGVILRYGEPGQERYTTVPDTKRQIPQGTLSAILGAQQTNLGMAWLRKQLGQ